MSYTNHQVPGVESEETDAKGFPTDINGNLLTIRPVPGISHVEKHSGIYNMKHARRGKAVIFNHMKFANGKAPRKGSDVDERHLHTCFASLGFVVIIHRDLTGQEIDEVVETLQAEDHTDSDCLLMVVMSHGAADNKIFSFDSHYKPETLWKSFTADLCPTLAGKPKIFLFQACRGDQFDDGVRLIGGRTQDDSLFDQPPKDESYVVPKMADFLIVYSTVEGFYSWRDPVKGSVFMQALVKVLRDHTNKTDLLSMMTMVARRVATNFESRVFEKPALSGKKQMPIVTSTLIRDIYFH